MADCRYQFVVQSRGKKGGLRQQTQDSAGEGGKDDAISGVINTPSGLLPRL